MANPNMRIIIPRKPDPLLGLSWRILQKHQVDGNQSPLRVFDMNDFENLHTLADAKNELAREKGIEKKIGFEQRDLALGIAKNQSSGLEGTVKYYILSVRDVLLGANRGKEQMLGDHGFEVSVGGTGKEVNIPLNADKLIALAVLILAKHDADGANSLLRSLNMEEFRTLTTQANEQNTIATKAKREKKTAFSERNLLLGIAPKQKSTEPGSIRFYVTSVRDVLQGISKGREKELGGWGFEVNDVIRKKRRKKSEMGAV